MNLFHIEQKKGKIDYYDGRLTAYAIVDIDPAEILSQQNNPIVSLIHNGLLVAQGNYREQNSLKDFLQAEFADSLEEGIDAFIERLNGLEGAFDPQKLKEKLKNLDEIKDIFPTPAKIVPFHSEEEILNQEGDIFFLGMFKNIANANLSVSALPILYQARFREQEIATIKNEIELLISQIENTETLSDHYSKSGIDIQEKILKEYIPVIFHAKKDQINLDAAISKFKSFLKGYPYPEDIDRIVGMITTIERMNERHIRLLELYSMKISAVCKEKFDDISELSNEIASIEKELSGS